MIRLVVGPVVLGVTVLWGCWVELGALLAARLVPGKAVHWAGSTAAGIGVWALVAGLAFALQLASAFAVLQTIVGVGLFARAVLRWVRKRPSLDLPYVTAALVAGAIAIWIAYPAFVATPDGMRLDGFYLLDGLWFAGSTVALDQGLPPPDFRLVEVDLHYQYMALLVGRCAGLTFPGPQAAVLYYVVAPVFVGLIAALGAVIAGQLEPRCKHPAWVAAAALATTYLTDGASALRWLGTGTPALGDYLAEPVPHFVLGNHHTIGLLINLPTSLSVLLALAAVHVLLCMNETPGVRRGLIVGSLVVLAGMAKGPALPLIACGAGAIAIRAVWPKLFGAPLLRAMLHEALIVGGLCVAGMLGLSLLVGGGGLVKVNPGYMVDFLSNYARSLTAWHDALPFDSAVFTMLVWVVFGLAWQLVLFAPIRGPGRALRAVAGVMILAGVVAANTFEFTLTGGGNELYFSSWTLSLTGPLVVAALAQMRARWARALAAVALAVGLFGTLHVLVSHRLSGAHVERKVSPDQLEVLDWVRTQTPSNATVLYFRTTTLEGDPRRPRVPTNDQGYLISGLAERQAVSEGSFYGGLWALQREHLIAVRADVQRFYAAQMRPDQATAFFERHRITHVLSEPGIDLRAYAEIMTPVTKAGRYVVFEVK